jgi:hypothetical protein
MPAAELIPDIGQLLMLLGVIGAAGSALVFGVVTIKRRRPAGPASLADVQRGAGAVFLGGLLITALGALVVGIV